MNYFAYVRVSTRHQGRYGVSLDEQAAAIESYAAARGLTIIKWFEGPNLSKVIDTRTAPIVGELFALYATGE